MNKSRCISAIVYRAVFGNLDLATGKEERKISFYPTNATSNKNVNLTFSNGIVFDAKKGEISLGQQKKSVKYFIATQNTCASLYTTSSQVFFFF